MPEATPMKALVTGGTGFVGGAIVRELRRRGHHVRVLARPTSKTAALEAQGVEIVRGDILDRESLRRALEGCDTLFHAAAIYEVWVRDKDLLLRTEVEGTRNAMEAALAAGLERVVYTSTAACVGERRGETGTEETRHRGYFLTAYEEAKYRAEEAVRQYAERLPVVIIQPAAVAGPGDLKPTGQAVIDMINGRFPALFDGALSFVDIGDVAWGHVAAAEQGRWGETYILSAEILTTRQLFGLVAELAGVRRPPFVPAFAAGWFARFEEWRARRTGRRPILTMDSFRIARHGFRVDGSKAARELGIRYRPIRESLRDAIRWYWEQGLLERRPACAE